MEDFSVCSSGIDEVRFGFESFSKLSPNYVPIIPQFHRQLQQKHDSAADGTRSTLAVAKMGTFPRGLRMEGLWGDGLRQRPIQ